MNDTDILPLSDQRVDLAQADDILVTPLTTPA